MALERQAYTGPSRQWEHPGCQASTSRAGAVVSMEALWARAWVEPPQVQISVVVANIQTRTLKTEVEKGSM